MLEKIEKVYLSSLVNNQGYLQLYLKSILYTLRFLNKDYSDFNQWYTGKVYQGLFSGEREVVVYLIDDYIAAVSILKNSLIEKKISTIRVVPKYRSHGLGTRIIEDAIDFLEYEKPIITIPENKFPQYLRLIKHYGFKLSDVSNYYCRNINRELFFNL